MRTNDEKGQAIIFLVLAMGIFLIGALGLAIDASQLYGHQRMAQTAADAAAQAGILSIFNGTNTGSNAFGSAAHTCSATDAITPCAYARKNGFGATTDDTVYIDFPGAAAIGLDPASLSASSPVNIIRVTITRSVHAGLIQLLGAGTTTPIKAVAAGAIVDVQSPTPLIITHPTLAHSLSTNGTTNIEICGGPPRSVQVNSSDPNAYASPKAGGTIDLSKAGPNDPGDCSTGTGADFGTFGGAATNPGSVSLGSTGKYVQPSSPIDDPLRNVAAPSPVGLLPGGHIPITTGTDGCTYANCWEYKPGLYVGGIDTSPMPPGYGVIFRPGLYYIQGGGFTLKNTNGGGGALNGYNAMCVGCPGDPATGTGMVIYDTGPAGSTLGNDPSGGFNISTGVSATLQGSTLMTTNNLGQPVPAPPYYNILFWEDRDADAHTGSQPTRNGGAHSFGQGNGCFTLLGTIYVTNYLPIMKGNASHYQEVQYNGTPCSTTVQQGYIIVSSLQVVGTMNIKMKLLPYGFITIRQVALVH